MASSSSKSLRCCWCRAYPAPFTAKANMWLFFFFFPIIYGLRAYASSELSQYMPFLLPIFFLAYSQSINLETCEGVFYLIRAFGIWYNTESVSEWCDGDSKKRQLFHWDYLHRLKIGKGRERWERRGRHVCWLIVVSNVSDMNIFFQWAIWTVQV